MLNVSCECGEIFHASNDQAGRFLRCWKCNRLLEVRCPDQPSTVIKTNATGQGATVFRAAGQNPRYSGKRYVGVLLALSSLTIAVIALFLLPWFSPRFSPAHRATPAKPKAAQVPSDQIDPNPLPPNSADIANEFDKFRRSQSRPKGHRKVQAATTPMFKETYLGTDEEPMILISNNANREIIIQLGKDEYRLGSHKEVSLRRHAGQEEFRASASGVRPLAGEKVWKRGYRYEWSFWIKQVP